MLQGVALGIVLVPFIFGGMVIGTMLRLNFVNGTVLFLALTIGSLMLHDFFLKRINPDAFEAYKISPAIWKALVGLYFFISLLLFWLADLPITDRAHNTPLMKFFACMILAVPWLCICSIAFNERDFGKRYIARLLAETQAKLPKPPEPVPEWTPAAAPIKEGERSFAFDPDKFKRP